MLVDYYSDVPMGWNIVQGRMDQSSTSSNTLPEQDDMRRHPLQGKRIRFARIVFFLSF
jgi:hypothetical protein